MLPPARRVADDPHGLEAHARKFAKIFVVFESGLRVVFRRNAVVIHDDDDRCAPSRGFRRGPAGRDLWVARLRCLEMRGTLTNGEGKGLRLFALLAWWEILRSGFSFALRISQLMIGSLALYGSGQASFRRPQRSKSGKSFLSSLEPGDPHDGQTL
jgi:hypothetical protein